MTQEGAEHLRSQFLFSLYGSWLPTLSVGCLKRLGLEKSFKSFEQRVLGVQCAGHVPGRRNTVSYFDAFLPSLPFLGQSPRVYVWHGGYPTSGTLEQPHLCHHLLTEVS